MKVLLAGILLTSLVICLTNAKSLQKQGNSRTHGNFGPKPKKTFEIRPAAQLGEHFRNADPIAAAQLYISMRSNVALESVRVSGSHTNRKNGITHVYLQQTVNGLDVANAVANVNIDRNGQIISVGNSFYTNDAPSPNFAVDKLSAAGAVKAFAKFLHLDITAAALQQSPINSANGAPTFSVSGAPFALVDIPAELKYIQREGGVSASLVWSLRVDMKDNVYNAFVDVETEEVVSLIDWVADATYNAYPLGINDPDSGTRQQIRDPAHPVASPLGWHDQGVGGKHTDTISNNVYAQENLDGGGEYINNHRPDGGAELNFDFPIDFTKDPEEYLDATIVNLFYWNNIIHDFFYVYGFNEESGNFQHDNLERGGEGRDSVIANAQDGSGTDNANFMTPPDGEQGRMRMYVWTYTDPRRDGDLDGGIVFHEFCHGLSNRLTGGPSNVGCLGFGESGGMGEGWGDFFATVTRTTPESTRDDVYAMGDYSTGDPNGIRQYKYSTDMTINPSTYETVEGAWGVHAIGEIWAVFLYDVFWNIVDKHGFDADWFNVEPADGKLGGNVITIQLVVDGMKLQPCQPTFVEARDAILQADEANNNGENFCEIWKAFAKRGLGVNVRDGDYTNNHDVPSQCE